VVCDDSVFMQRLVRQTCESAGDIEVVATCSTAAEAIDACVRLQPDVLTLDLELPDANGIEVIRTVRDRGLSTRVLVVSNYTSSAASERAVAALAEGAIDCMGKPGIGDSSEDFMGELMTYIRGVGASASVVQRATAPRDRPSGSAGHEDRLFVLGASTGGPLAIEAVLTALPESFACPIAIVQHMPDRFSQPFARRLAAVTGRDVREAVDGDALRPGSILVAPSGSHLRIERSLVRIDDGDPLMGSRPSLDLALLDAAGSWGDHVTAVVMTGMGSDGCRGAEAVHTAGGTVIAQQQRSCTVYGMPRAVVDAGIADAVVPLNMIAACLAEEAGL
jgi:two-component system chemotaxis response regulator CheB